MKKWKSPSGVVYRRFRKGIVFTTLDFLTRFYRVRQNGRLETSWDWLARWSPDGPPEAREAIAALWPKPTRDQLWRRVARLAGELIFSSQYSTPFEVDAMAPSEAIRSLIQHVRDFDAIDSIDKRSHERIIAKLEAACMGGGGMTYRSGPDQLPKPPAGFFAAMGKEPIFVAKRPNWIQRTFTPFPYVYMDFARPKESYSWHVSAATIGLTLACCGYASTALASLIGWLLLILLGFTGVFHERIEIMEWKAAK